LGQVSGKAGLAEAIHYALHYWQRLVLFLEDGRLERERPGSPPLLIGLGRRS
jgi:hypothetical protein